MGAGCLEDPTVLLDTAGGGGGWQHVADSLPLGYEGKGQMAQALNGGGSCTRGHAVRMKPASKSGRWERVPGTKAGQGQAACVGWGVKAGCLETEDSMTRDREMGRKE